MTAPAPHVDESGLPRHLPMGLTADGQGPTEPDTPHHRGCWCGDPDCAWALALAAERAEAVAAERERIATAIRNYKDGIDEGEAVDAALYAVLLLIDSPGVRIARAGGTYDHTC